MHYFKGQNISSHWECAASMPAVMLITKALPSTGIANASAGTEPPLAPGKVGGDSEERV